MFIIFFLSHHNIISISILISQRIDSYNNTQAMILASNNLSIPQNLYHSPELCNNKKQTVALLLSSNGTIPPTQWNHISSFQQQDGKTVAMLLVSNKINPPQQWWHHSDLQDNQGNTVAMLFQMQNLDIPTEWIHNSEIQNTYGNTVAILQSTKGIIPQKEWYHDPLIKNYNNDTVAIILSSKGIIPPKEWMHDINIKNKNNQSIKSNLQKHNLPIPAHWKKQLDIFDQACYKIIPQNNEYLPDEQNEDGWTIAMILSKFKLQIPQCWYHDPLIRNIYGQTVFDICVENNQVPPKQFCIDPNQQDINGNTQAMILALNNIQIPNYLYHNPQIQNNDGYTIALIQAKNGDIPDKQWLHDKYLRVKYCNKNQKVRFMTVQNFLLENNKSVPEEWQYTIQNENEDNKQMLQARQGQIPKRLKISNPEKRNINGQTVAIILAYQSIIPPKQWQHNKQLKDQNDNTVGIILSSNGIIPPMNWIHNVDLENKDNNSIRSNLQKYQLPVPRHFISTNLTIFDQACYGQIPQLGSHKPYEQNEDGFTIAMILAVNKIKIPKEWYHISTLKNKYNQTVYDILKQNNQEISAEWIPNNENISQENKQIIDQYCQYYNIQTNYQLQPTFNDNIDKQTVAMWLAKNRRHIPEYWYHKPDMKNNEGYTVALLQAERHTIPNKQWQHNKFLRVKRYDNKDQKYKFMTVKNIFDSYNIQVPIFWYYKLSNNQNTEDNTDEMLEAKQGLIPNMQQQNNPQQTNIYGQTVAMLLAQNGIIPPYNIWGHQPQLRDINNNTVAILLAKNGIIPPQQWYHDPLIQNTNGQTVGILLASNGLIPPNKWLHDVNIKDNQNRSIKSNLLAHNYKYVETNDIYNKFVYKYQLQQLNDTCQICLTEGEQVFIKSKCGHHICLNCFQHMDWHNIRQCPVCKNRDWYYIDERYGQQQSSQQYYPYQFQQQQIQFPNIFMF